MKHSKISLLIILIIYILGACGSQNTRTGGVKIKKGGISGPIVTGSNTIINQYNEAVEIRNVYKDSVTNDARHLDSIFLAIRTLELKLSVFNNTEITKRDSKVIRKETLKLKKSADSIAEQKLRHEEKLRYQNLLMEELKERKIEENGISKKLGELDSLNSKELKIKDFDTVEYKIGFEPVRAISKQGNPKILYSQFNANASPAIEDIENNIRKHNSSIESLSSYLNSLQAEQNSFQAALKYAVGTPNVYNIEELKKTIDENNKTINNLRLQLGEQYDNRDFNQYLISKINYIKFDSSRIQNVVRPMNGREFLEALKNNTRIILQEMDYDISPTEVGIIKNSNIEYYDYFDITNLRNVEIIGIGKSETHIFSNVINTPVLNFRDVQGLKIKNVKLGHSGFLREEDVACGPGGDVIEMRDSFNIDLEGVLMYGCGTQGIDLFNSGDITIKDSKIYDCTNGVVSINNSFNIQFEDCLFTDNLLDYRSIFDISRSKNLYINNSEIANNRISPNSENNFRSIKVFSNYKEYSNVFVENTVIKNNVTDYFSYHENPIKMYNVDVQSNNIYKEQRFQSEQD